MRLIKTIALLLIFTSFTQAQNFAIPEKEFAVYLPVDEISIARGDSATFKIIILKSKGYLKSKTNIGLSTELPKGLKVTFTPHNGVYDQAIGKIYVSKDVEIEKLSIVVSAEMKYLLKGNIFTINIK